MRKPAALLAAVALLLSSIPAGARNVAVPRLKAVPITAAPAISPALRASQAAVPSVLAAPGLLSPAAQQAPISAEPAALLPAGAPAPAAALAASVETVAAALAVPADAGHAAAADELTRTFDGGASAGAAPVETAMGAAFRAARNSIKRSLESIGELKIGAYNLENLFDHVGSFEPDPKNPGKMRPVKNDSGPKDEKALLEQAALILREDFDVLTVSEVENIEALRDFNERFLGGIYDVHLIEGNDERGIDVAFLVKKDLPLVVEHRSHKDETWDDPLWGPGRKLFSRDLPVLLFRTETDPKPLFALFGTHYKSKRDRDKRDKESNFLRGAQVQRTAEIIARYRAEFGEDLPIMLAGDFNGALGEEDAFKPLYEAAGLTDAFDASPNPPSARDRISHTYHPRAGKNHPKQMDGILVSKGLRGTVKSATAVRYVGPDGRERPMPTSHEERSANPSDHFPIKVVFDFKAIRERNVPEWSPAPRAPPRPDENIDFFAADDLIHAQPELRKSVMALARAYLAAPVPDRAAAYALPRAYYEGEAGLAGLTAEQRRQAEAMLAVLETVVPRASARFRAEPRINVVLNTFLPLLKELDPSRGPEPPPVHPRDAAEQSRAFVEAARAWQAESGAAFDAVVREWLTWANSPPEWLRSKGIEGYVGHFTLKNVPEIRRRLVGLLKTKEAFDKAIAGSSGAPSVGSARALFRAWDALGAAVEDSKRLLADSWDPDRSKQGLVANSDKVWERHPKGTGLFVEAARAIDRDAVRALEALVGADPR